MEAPQQTAEAQPPRRPPRSPATHPYVIGRLRLDPPTKRVSLYALEETPDGRVGDTKDPTARSDRWYRWKSSQAANKWLREHKLYGLANLQAINLDTLDVEAEAQ